MKPKNLPEQFASKSNVFKSQGGEFAFVLSSSPEVILLVDWGLVFLNFKGEKESFLFVVTSSDFSLSKSKESWDGFKYWLPAPAT